MKKTAILCSFVFLIALIGSGAACSSSEESFCAEQEETEQYGQCQIRWTDCDDTATYVVECNLYGSGAWECECLRNGEQGQTFAGPKDRVCPDVARVNERCGWDL